MRSHLRFIAAATLVAVGAGITGWVCAQFLHILEGLIWGEGFPALREAVHAATPRYRFGMLIAAGIVGAVSWALFFRGPSPVSAKAGIAGAQIPFWRTVWHSLTQIVVVGMGASIGREVAPREISVSIASKVTEHFEYVKKDRALLIACASGAGLAAVYTLPLSGALFALESLREAKKPKPVLTALYISTVATVIGTIGHWPTPFYTLPHLEFSWHLIAWAIIAGPLCGIAGWTFGRAVSWAESARPRNLHLLWSLPLTFAAVGALMMYVPEVAGNGQAVAQSAFDATPATLMSLVVVLMLAKLLATLGTIRAGAWGGTLTPGIAIGAGVGALLGAGWSLLIPGTPIVTFAFMGSAAFLAASMKMPATAMLLLFEFTHSGATLIVPMAIIVTLAWVTMMAIDLRQTPRN